MFHRSDERVLTIRGEKRDEKEEKKKDYYMRERSFGSFERSFQVPENVDTSKIDASFKKGVLTIMPPKSAEAQRSEKKIEVKASDRFQWKKKKERSCTPIESVGDAEQF